MKSKVVSILLAVTLVVTILGGCGNDNNSDVTTGANNDTTTASVETPAVADSGELPILGASIYSAADNFNSYIGKNIANAAEGIFTTNIEDAQNDQSTQNNQVDTMLAKGAKAICLSIVDTTAAQTILDKAVDAGNIPVIFFNKEITDEEVMKSYDNAFFVGTSAADSGTMQGEMVVQAWNDNPDFDKNGDGVLQIVNLMGDPGHTASSPRAEYVKKAIEDAGLEYELLAEDTAMWVTATATDKMDAWISKYGDEIEFIIAANDAMALGALASIQNAGFNTDGVTSEKYIPIVGIDALPEMLSKIETGEVIGSVLQDPKAQGEAVVVMAKNLVEGKDAMEGLELTIDELKAVRIPYQKITNENLEIAEEIYSME